MTTMKQIKLAKEILESAGYEVTLKEEKSTEFLKDYMYSIQSMINRYGGIELFSHENEGTDVIDIPCKLLDGDYHNVYMIDDEDDNSHHFFDFWRSLDKEDGEVVDFSDGYCFLVTTEYGEFVYQNMSGLIVIYKKF